MQRAGTLLLALVAGLLLPPAGAGQMRDYGMLAPRDPKAFDESGVVNFHLKRDGNRFEAEVFGLENQWLADCEFEWLDTSTEMRCDVADRGKYEMRWTKATAEFKELATGEWFKETADFGPPGPPRIQHVEPGQPRPRTLPPPVHFEGSQSQEETYRLWYKIAAIFRHVLAESELTMGFSNFYRFHGLDLGADVKEAPPEESINLCPDGHHTVCSNSSWITGAASGSNGGVCCLLASGQANVLCLLSTGRGCCANGLCDPVCFAGFCSCSVEGWVWACQDPCEP